LCFHYAFGDSFNLGAWAGPDVKNQIISEMRSNVALHNFEAFRANGQQVKWHDAADDLEINNPPVEEFHIQAACEHFRVPIMVLRTDSGDGHLFQPTTTHLVQREPVMVLFEPLKNNYGRYYGLVPNDSLRKDLQKMERQLEETKMNEERSKSKKKKVCIFSLVHFISILVLDRFGYSPKISCTTKNCCQKEDCHQECF
jgi:hypothetical protein